MKLTIEVTQDDIDQGNASRYARHEAFLPRTETCPVARALRRVTGKNWSVGSSILMTTRDHRGNVLLPADVRWFISNFDKQDGPVEPSTFIIEVPDNLYEANR